MYLAEHRSGKRKQNAAGPWEEKKNNPSTDMSTKPLFFFFCLLKTPMFFSL